MLKSFFSAIVFQPLYNALIILYVIYPDMGVSIVLLTLIIRFLILPIARKSIESQKKMQEIQPQLKKIQQKYKNDKQLQGQKVMEFYKQNKINPAGGCLPLIIQLIIFIALYRVFMLGLGEGISTDLLYSFTKNPGQPNPIAFGFLDLTAPSIPLAFAVAILQFVQGKMMMLKNKKNQPKKEPEKNDEPDFASMMQTQMIYMMPIMILFLGFKFSSGLLLYWATTTIFMIVQQYYVIKKDGNVSLKEIFSFKKD